MALEFLKHTGNPDDFFKILPVDWQEALQLVWEKGSATSEIFVLKEENKVIAGGILFKDITADMQFFKEEAQLLLASKSYYIGYLWVLEARRGEDLGSLWLKSLKQYYPDNYFWLTIEEEGLIRFYEKNNFKLSFEKECNSEKEWLLKSI
ncbi:GCN5-related N-acetyltransferase [Cellulophaga algicola DSM 14237]|uniref:GCN5-related N-acetyltransferase n=1 Tax=Cellulophaga algicola (strain DSM 14237 / IC166 / ACAM 630) TaxID=688270 RepID=E6XBR0_CELAD|nr:GNAT family N-acetyltransferase [Cellulophaga algicola]ADV47895.1 GCN5-related N-acetyltransferase [Cellulophaga algicola DSM 14237]